MKLFCNLFKPTLAHISTKSKCIIQPKNLPILVSCYISNNIFTEKKYKIQPKTVGQIEMPSQMQISYMSFHMFKKNMNKYIEIIKHVILPCLRLSFHSTRRYFLIKNPICYKY